jgi:hypothetical protein
LRSRHSLSYSRTSQRLMGPEGSSNIHKSSSTISILSIMNSRHTTPAYLSNIHLNIILPPSLEFLVVALLNSHQKPICIPPFSPCVLHVPYISPSSYLTKGASYEALRRSKRASDACASAMFICKPCSILGGDYEECRLLGYKTQFVPHKNHITSPLRSPAG